MVRRRSLFFVLLVLLAIPPAQAAPLSGVARAVDGDTIAFGRARVRIWGIDAPEKLQPCRTADVNTWSCGLRAQQALANWLGGRSLSCRMRDRDANGRPVATCTAGDQDVAAWLVQQGWAFDYPRYSGGTYTPFERGARAARRNIWSGEVMAPWLWRAEQRQRAPRRVDSVASTCPFKGNINRGGRRIVHAPGQRDYASVRIDPLRGERWFCSLSEARAAGWRPAAR